MTGQPELPPGWTWASIEEISAAEPRSITDGPFGSNLKTEHYTASGARVIRLQNIGDGVFRNDKAFIGLDHFSRLEAHGVQVGDVLIASLGEELPRACLAPDLRGPAIVKADCIRFRPHPAISAEYVMWALNSSPMRASFKDKIHGLGRPRLNLRELRGARIPLAPADEQRRIVHALHEHLSRVTAAEQDVAGLDRRLKVLRDAIRNDVVRRALAMTGGATRAAGSVADVQGGIQKQPARWATDSEGVPFLRVANVGRGALDLSEVHRILVKPAERERVLLRRGDLLVVEGNGSPGQIGRAALWDGSIDPCTHQNHLIRVRPRAGLIAEYLELVWNAPTTVAQLKAVASSTSGLHTLSTGKVKSVQLPVPGTTEQEHLVARAQAALSTLQATARARDGVAVRLHQLRGALLANAFRGALVAQAAADEPADVLLKRIAEERALTVSPARRRRDRTVHAAPFSRGNHTVEETA